MVQLTESQLAAGRLIESSPVSCFTGGPGTGKTTTLAEYIKETHEIETYCFAPTGRAAQRMMEAFSESGLNLGARTIHAGLIPDRTGYDGNGWSFCYNEENPLPCDRVVLDETSMCDNAIFSSLLRAIKPGAQLICVGDPDQLPPVGKGKPFLDMIKSGVVPHAHLTEVHRFAGRIAHVCQRINEGKPFAPSPNLDLDADAGEFGPENLRHIERRHPHEAMSVLATLVGKVKERGFNPFTEMQVIVSRNDAGPVNRKLVNEKLQSLLNPAGKRIEGCPFRVGDKVMCLKNGFRDTYTNAGNGFKRDQGSVYTSNGESGIVVDVNVKSIIVRFGGVSVLFPKGSWDTQVCLAYAITVHKCVHPDTLVETESGGLQRIRDIAESGKIATHENKREYRNKVENPPLPAVKLITDEGYAITVTEEHKCEVIRNGKPEMVLATEVKQGDFVRLKLFGGLRQPARDLPVPESEKKAVEYRTPSKLDADTAEFIGLMVADGTVFEGGFRIVKRYQSVVNRAYWLCRRLFGITPKLIEVENAFGIEVSSRQLVKWLRSIGGMEPNKKFVPDVVMSSDTVIQSSFLKGLFEDGGVNRSIGKECVQWGNKDPWCRHQVKQMLLRIGIVCSEMRNELFIYSIYAERFRMSIGFIADEKNEHLRELNFAPPTRLKVPVSREIASSWPITNETRAVRERAMQRGYVSMASLNKHKLTVGDKGDWHYTQVASIENTVCESMCVEVPYGHKFVQDGFAWGNSQGGAWPIVVYMIDDTRLNDRSLVYTAISRSKKICFTVGRMAVLNQQIQKVSVVNRKTFLKEILKEKLCRTRHVHSL